MNEISNKTYQTAYIIPINDWNDVTKRLDRLENERFVLTESEEKETIFDSKETARILNLHPLSLGRARKEGRIRGMKKNGREYQYSSFEIAKYRKRYPRYNDGLVK